MQRGKKSPSPTLQCDRSSKLCVVRCMTESTGKFVSCWSVETGSPREMEKFIYVLFQEIVDEAVRRVREINLTACTCANEWLCNDLRWLVGWFNVAISCRITSCSDGLSGSSSDDVLCWLISSLCQISKTSTRACSNRFFAIIWIFIRQRMTADKTTTDR